MNSKKKILLIVTPLVFLADKISKMVIVSFLPRGDFIPVIPEYFDIVHTKNRGAAFGILANLPESIRLPFFFIFSLVALTILFIYFIRHQDSRRSAWMAAALILGGALGNLSDRLTAGEVTDFLSFHWQNKRVLNILLEWPAFNVADMAISIGVILLSILMVRSTKHQGGS